MAILINCGNPIDGATLCVDLPAPAMKPKYSAVADVAGICIVVTFDPDGESEIAAVPEAAAQRPVYQHVVEAQAGPNSVILFIGTESEVEAKVRALLDENPAKTTRSRRRTSAISANAPTSAPPG